MTKTNNRSACGLDNRRQAELPGLSIGSYFKLSFGKLSCIERKLSRIEKIEPQNVNPHQAWMIKVS